MHVHEDGVGAIAQLGERGVDLGERRAHGIQEELPGQVDHRKPARAGLHDRGRGRAALRVVRRAHDALLAVEEAVDVPVPVGVAAEGDRVRTRLEQVSALFSVIPTPPAEFSPFTTTKSGRGRRAARAAGRPASAGRAAHHVADEQELHQETTRSDSANLRAVNDSVRRRRPSRARRAPDDRRARAGQERRRAGGSALGVAQRRPRRAGGGDRAQRRGQDDAAVDPRRHPAPGRGSGRRSCRDRCPSSLPSTGRTVEENLMLFGQARAARRRARLGRADAHAHRPRRAQGRSGGHPLGRKPPAREHRHRPAGRAGGAVARRAECRAGPAPARAAWEFILSWPARARRSSTPPITSRRRIATPRS